MFIRDYLSLKTQSIPAMNKVYMVFKNYVEDHNIETEVLLKDLLTNINNLSILEDIKQN